MNARAWTIALLVAGMAVTSPARAGEYAEAPMLSERVASGALPPVEARLPDVPSRVDLAALGREPGRYGGALRLLMGREKDIRLMVVYGYARLVAYDERYELVPDLLQSVDVEEGRVFTLGLRKGLRWSDGHPLTAEDFRYYWEDIAGNQELAPFGPPSRLLVDGEVPTFEVVDEFTVRYTWTRPNPFFLPALAGARPEPIYAPAHYLKQFHAAYADQAGLEAQAKEEGRQKWSSVHINRFRPYKNNNPALPSVQPWVPKTRPPSQRFVFERNPYYHRVDGKGRQLPYLDRIILNIADKKLIPAKAGAGEADLQARSLSFSDFTFLKENEERSGYRVLLWDTTRGSDMALYPNLNAEDPAWRKLLRDRRFRHALSLAIDRDEINQVIYYGLATIGNDTVYSTGPLFKEHYRTAWTQFDPGKANALLDELGLTERNDEGIRLLPDGRALELIVETAGESTEQTDVLQLIEPTWRKVGVKLFTKPLQREVFRNRIFSGQTLMSVWFGLENGLPTADMTPRALAPVSQQSYQWPKWGQHHESRGSKGEAPDLPAAVELLELNSAWLNATDKAERERIWHRMLEIRARETFTIGLVSGVPQPVVANARLRNLPEQGVYNWDPGAHFGLYRPDTFWLAPK